jgi:hypothetical protein
MKSFFIYSGVLSIIFSIGSPPSLSDSMVRSLSSLSGKKHIYHKTGIGKKEKVLKVYG